MAVFRGDPCGIICLIITYVSLFYADYVVIRHLMIPSMSNTLWGAFNAVIFNTILFLASVSHLRAVLSDPGIVQLPTTGLDFSDLHAGKTMPNLKDGWSVCMKCEAYRPPRAHHCRICRRCVKKMDHHCPWINNCVGELNQKYFVQFLFYIGLSSVYATTLVIATWIVDPGIGDKHSRLIHSVLLVVESLLFGMFVLAIGCDQSSDTDLATIMKAVVGHSPYPKKLTVKVLCSDPATTYINDKKEKRELMNTVIADSSKVVKCVVYDAKKFHRFKAGTTIILRNIIRKPDGIAVTSATVIFPAPKTLNLPPYMEKEGMAILHPPPADVKTVEEALASPTKTKVSVRGKIIQEEATRLVTVKNEENVKVKNIFLEDSTKKCKIALWRNLADQTIRPGDYVEVSDCITNTFRNEVSLSTTSRTTITLSAILSDETGIEHVKKEEPTRPKKSSFALMQEVFGRACISPRPISFLGPSALWLILESRAYTGYDMEKGHPALWLFPLQFRPVEIDRYDLYHV